MKNGNVSNVGQYFAHIERNASSAEKRMSIIILNNSD